jgi:cell division initiation protein
MFDPALTASTSACGSREDRESAPAANDGDRRGAEARRGGAPRALNNNEDRRMKVSPLDLRQQRFRSAFRGFDKVEVTSFLAAAADDYEQALRETDRLRQDLARIEAVLNEHREHEKNLQSTLMTAQKLSDDIKASAELEARRIIREAEGRSDLLLEKTQSRLEDIQREIDGLKLKRRDVETSIESTMQALRNTLEYVREQEAREREDKILLHRPRHAEQPSADQREPLEARRIQGLP